MARLEILCIVSSGMALILGSCVVPKATAVEAAPVVGEKAKKAPVPEPSLKDEPVAHLPENSIRMPNYLEFPDDGNFRRGGPRPGTNSAGTGAVTSQPPTEPPSRVKPPPKDGE